jgi:hypothetical protein
MAAPFTDQGEAAVCARVAIALLKRKNAQADFSGTQPTILIGIVVATLDGLQLPTVRLALLSLSVWVMSGRQSAAWLKSVLYADCIGLPLRRCFYSDYKANRRR